MPATLIPEVADLIRQGRLPAFDADWIKNLAPENQLAAAEKMLRISYHKPVYDMPRTRINEPSMGKARPRR